MLLKPICNCSFLSFIVMTESQSVVKSIAHVCVSECMRMLLAVDALVVPVCESASQENWRKLEVEQTLNTTNSIVHYVQRRGGVRKR